MRTKSSGFVAVQMDSKREAVFEDGLEHGLELRDADATANDLHFMNVTLERQGIKHMLVRS